MTEAHRPPRGVTLISAAALRNCMSSASAPARLGHVHIRVCDLKRSVAFYESVLGLSITQRRADLAYLAAGDRHHDLVLEAVGNASGPGSGIGISHSAWEVESPAALRDAHGRLRRMEIDVSPVDHGISKALYFDDPDGNGVELYLDTRAVAGRDRWDGRNREFDPAALG